MEQVAKHFSFGTLEQTYSSLSLLNVGTVVGQDFPLVVDGPEPTAAPLLHGEHLLGQPPQAQEGEGAEEQEQEAHRVEGGEVGEECHPVGVPPVGDVEGGGQGDPGHEGHQAGGVEEGPGRRASHHQPGVLAPRVDGALRDDRSVGQGIVEAEATRRLGCPSPLWRR